MFIIIKKYGGDFISSNDIFIIKCKIDKDLNAGFRKVLEEKKLTQQDVLEKLIKEYVISNITSLLKTGKDDK